MDVLHPPVHPALYLTCTLEEHPTYNYCLTFVHLADMEKVHMEGVVCSKCSRVNLSGKTGCGVLLWFPKVGLVAGGFLRTGKVGILLSGPSNWLFTS